MKNTPFAKTIGKFIINYKHTLAKTFVRKIKLICHIDEILIGIEIKMYFPL